MQWMEPKAIAFHTDLELSISFSFFFSCFQSLTKRCEYQTAATNFHDNPITYQNDHIVSYVILKILLRVIESRKILLGKYYFKHIIGMRPFSKL